MESEKVGCGGHCTCAPVTIAQSSNKNISDIIDAEDDTRLRAHLAAQNPRAALRQIREDIKLVKFLRKIDADETKITVVLNKILALTGEI